MDLLFESSKDLEKREGVFILWLSSSTLPIIEHTDRICSALGIQIADRSKIRACYQNFASKQPKNTYVKFLVKLETIQKEFTLNEATTFFPEVQKAFSFSDVQEWDTQGQMKPIQDVIQQFNLNFIRNLRSSAELSYSDGPVAPNQAAHFLKAY